MLVFPLLLLATLGAAYSNKIILVRHGEKEGAQPENGLNKNGIKRAKCFRQLFAPANTARPHNIGLIVAQSYDHDSRARSRPFETVKYLAKDLGLKVNTKCDREDHKCVKKLIKRFAKHSNKDVLICWKHSELSDIVRALGGKTKTSYPDDRYDIMWIMKNNRLISKESELCKGIDHVRRPDPDLEMDSKARDYFNDNSEEEAAFGEAFESVEGGGWDEEGQDEGYLGEDDEGESWVGGDEGEQFTFE